MSVHVVFIPGLKGSVLKSKSRIVWPPKTTEFLFGINDETYTALKCSYLFTDDIIHHLKFFGISYFCIYDKIIKELRKEYGEDRVKVFPYDWRMSIDGITDTLLKFLENTFTIENNNYFYLVGHSLGGIVATNILKFKTNELINKKLIGICTLASPLLGSFDAFVNLYLLKTKNTYYLNLLTRDKMHSLITNYQSIYDVIPYDTIGKRILIDNNTNRSVVSFLTSMQEFMQKRMKKVPYINKLFNGYKFSINFRKRLFDFDHKCARMNISVGAKRQLEVVDFRFVNKKGIVYWHDHNNGGDGIVNFSKPERLTSRNDNVINENVHTSICKNDFIISTLKEEINRCIHCVVNSKILFAKISSNSFNECMKICKHTTKFYSIEVLCFLSSRFRGQHYLLKLSLKIDFFDRDWLLKGVACFDRDFKIISSYDNIFKKEMEITYAEIYLPVNKNDINFKLYLEVFNKHSGNSNTEKIIIKN